MRFSKCVLLSVFFLSACGGRTGLLGPNEKPGFNDMIVEKDANTIQDQGVNKVLDRGNKSYLDKTMAMDQYRRDSCVPIPANQIVGKYKGDWTGTLNCPGYKQGKIKATVILSINQIGVSDSFKVIGGGKGTVSPLQDIWVEFDGLMKCDALVAYKFKIVIGTGALQNTLLGSMEGKYSSKPKGFQNGSWIASASKYNCTSKGKWEAH